MGIKLYNFKIRSQQHCEMLLQKRSYPETQRISSGPIDQQAQSLMFFPQALCLEVTKQLKRSLEEGSKANNSSATDCHYNLSSGFIDLLSSNTGIANKFCLINKCTIGEINIHHYIFLPSSKNIHGVKYLPYYIKIIKYKIDYKVSQTFILSIIKNLVKYKEVIQDLYNIQ